MPDFRHFEVRRQENVWVIRLIEPKLLSHLVVTELEDEIAEFLDRERPANIVVNFDRVQFSSTAVINGLLRCKKWLSNVGGQLKLCGMSANVREKYQMLKLDGPVFDIWDTEADALADLR
jgi:anti-anti-sigma factor